MCRYVFTQSLYHRQGVTQGQFKWSLDIGLAVRVFAIGPGDLGSIPGRVIPKTQKMVLDAFLLNTQHYKVQIKGKVEPSREGVAPSPTSWCSSYRKGSLRVTLDYGRLLLTSGFIQSFLFFKTGCLTKAKEVNRIYVPTAEGEEFKGIRAKWSANSFVEDLNSGYQFHFLW